MSCVLTLTTHCRSREAVFTVSHCFWDYIHPKRYNIFYLILLRRKRRLTEIHLIFIMHFNGLFFNTNVIKYLHKYLKKIVFEKRFFFFFFVSHISVFTTVMYRREQNKSFANRKKKLFILNLLKLLVIQIYAPLPQYRTCSGIRRALCINNNIII